MFAQSIPANPWEWVFYAGAVGALLLTLYLMLTGRLVPRSSVDAERAAHAESIRIRDEAIERLIGERDRFIELALRSTRAAEEVATPNLERVAYEAATEAVRRAGKDMS